MKTPFSTETSFRDLPVGGGRLPQTDLLHQERQAVPVLSEVAEGRPLTVHVTESVHGTSQERAADKERLEKYQSCYGEPKLYALLYGTRLLKYLFE